MNNAIYRCILFVLARTLCMRIRTENILEDGNGTLVYGYDDIIPRQRTFSFLTFRLLYITTRTFTYLCMSTADDI